MLRALVLLLTVITGFSGLAYEVTWQKYLGVLLGAHSEATASVLGLFLGGLSVGYWVFGTLTQWLVARGKAKGQPPPLLMVYGGIEASIGLYCLLFPFVFPWVLALSVWFPSGGGLFGFAIDVTLSALLIVPPAMLMGGTIPILTQALARSLEDATRFHAYVYAFNTLGAFLGAIAAGFVLIPLLGLDGVLRAMGLVNLAVGTIFILMGRTRKDVIDLDSGPELQGMSATSLVYGGVALLIGFAMMTLQTTIVRLGGLSFGSSEYTFSMVVAVFVLCIALGSLAVGALKTIGQAVLPLTLWGLSLWLAALHVPLGVSPYLGHLIRVSFDRNAASFEPFHVAALLGVLALVGPAVILSGAVLPLLFHAMRREVGDLGAQAGRLYSVNTVGSLLGALVGGYVLLTWFDLSQIYRIALGAVVLSAVLITGRTYPGFRWPSASGVVVVLWMGLAVFPAWVPGNLMPGLVRVRTESPTTWDGPTLPTNGTFLFYEDDPTSSVGVIQLNGDDGRHRSLVVNGKSDGSTRGDTRTMVLLGIVPSLFAEKTERAFVIGYGLGISVGELAQLDQMKEVQVAEISSAVVNAAPYFDFANHNASTDPKVKLIRSDAYRSLLRAEGEFDVIVSEPSNPWVTGVEMLYTREFLEAARDRLAPGGAYAQWYHVYESDDETLELVLRTYAEVFDHVAIWKNSEDLVLVGLRASEPANHLAQIEARLRLPDYQRALIRVGIKSPAALLVHEAVPFDAIQPALQEGPLQTLTHPRLSHQAARAFFREDSAALPFTGVGEAARIGRANSLLGLYLQRFGNTVPENTWDTMLRQSCSRGLKLCGPVAAAWTYARPNSEALGAALQWATTTGRAPWIKFLPVFQVYLGYSPPPARLDAENALLASRRFDEFYSHALPFDPGGLVSLWRHCGPANRPIPECQAGLDQAQKLLTGQASVAPRYW